MSQASNKASEIEEHDVEITITGKIECFICGEEDQEEVENAKEAMEIFRKNGWKIRESKKFQGIGAMCQTCCKTPDSQRGE